MKKELIVFDTEEKIKRLYKLRAMYDEAYNTPYDKVSLSMDSMYNFTWNNSSLYIPESIMPLSKAIPELDNNFSIHRDSGKFKLIDTNIGRIDECIKKLKL